MDYDNCRSLPAMFFEQAERLGDKPFLWAKHGGRYQPMSWAAAARDARRMARGLASLGIGRGDRVALVAENRPEWVIADLAIMSAGRDHGAGLRHQHRRRPPPHFRSERRLGRDRLPAAFVGACIGGGEPGRDCPQRDRDEPAAGQASAVDLLTWDEVLSKGDVAPTTWRGISPRSTLMMSPA